MIRDAEDRRDKIDALAVRFQHGEFSEAVYRASLYANGLRRDDIDYIVNSALAGEESPPPSTSRENRT